MNRILEKITSFVKNCMHFILLKIMSLSLICKITISSEQFTDSSKHHKEKEGCVEITKLELVCFNL